MRVDLKGAGRDADALDPRAARRDELTDAERRELEIDGLAAMKPRDRAPRRGEIGRAGYMNFRATCGGCPEGTNTNDAAIHFAQRGAVDDAHSRDA